MREGKNKQSAGRMLKWGAGFLAAGAALQAAARMVDGFGEWYAVTVYPVITGTVGRFSGIFPISLSEIGLYVLCGLLLFLVIRYRRKWQRLLSGGFLGAAFLFFVYTVCCGVNYYRKPFSDYLDFRTEKYSSEELSELFCWLTDRVNDTYVETGTRSQWELGKAGQAAMERLGEEYPQLSGSYPMAKPLVVSRILSVQQLCGIYSPFTVEANYNKEMTPYNIPHTICHELSHLRGFMREDEANFIGFLACIGAEDPEYRYSGYLMGWIYAGNALASVDYRAYSRIRGSLLPEIEADLQANTEFWNRFESRISEAAEAMNDRYLRANSQEEGVRSYGRVVDLMLAWRREEAQ